MQSIPYTIQNQNHELPGPNASRITAKTCATSSFDNLSSLSSITVSNKANAP